MRVWTNGRGAHPRIYSHTLHQWTMDETAIGFCYDLLGDNELDCKDDVVITPASAAPGGPSIGLAARRFNGTSTEAYSSAYTTDAALVESACAVVVSFRLAAAATGRQPLVALGRTASAEKYVLDISIDSNLNVCVRWEDAGGGTVTTTFTTAKVRKSRWERIVVAWDASELHLHLNGGYVESKTPSAVMSPSTADYRWLLGNTDLGAASFLNGDIDSVTVHSSIPTSAEIEDDFRRMALLDAETVVHWRAEIQREDASWQDMGDFYGVDWLKGVKLHGDVDVSVGSATLEFWKSSGSMNLSLLHDNPANRFPLPSSTVLGPDDQDYTAFGNAGATEVLVPMRGVRIYCCRLPLGMTPVADDWMLRFEGYLGEPDWGGEADTVSVACQDISIKLTNAWVWDASQKFGGGILVEAVMQDILDYLAALTIGGHAMLDPAMTLAVEGTPAWTVSEYVQDRVAGIEALRNLAKQMGWDIRTKWNYATEAFALTLYEPDRLRRYPDIVLTAEEYRAVPSKKFSLDSVRNVVRVPYYTTEAVGVAIPTIATGTTTAAVGSRDTDPTDPDASQTYLALFTVTTEDLNASELGSASMDLFGPRVMELADTETEQIDSIAEAQAMGVGLLRDLCLPKCRTDLDAFQFPELEVNDFVRLRADGLHATSDEDAAVMTVEHDDQATSASLRGLPAGGVVSHLDGEGRTGIAPPPAVVKSNNDRLIGNRLRLAILDTMATKSGGMTSSGRAALIQNTNFDRRNFGSRIPFDGWEQDTGTWGTDARAQVGTGVLSGRAALQIDYHATNPCRLLSDFAPVNGAANQVVEVSAKALHLTATGSGAGAVKVSVHWYDYDRTYLSADVVIADATKSTQQEFRGSVIADSDARFFRIAVERDNSVSRHVVYSSVEPTIRQPQARVYLDTAVDTGTSPALSSKVPYTLLLTGATAPYGYNVAGLYNTGAGTFVPPSFGAGFYRITARMTVTYAGADGPTQIIIDDGSGVTILKSGMVSIADDDDDVTVELSAVRWLNDGTTLRMRAYLDAIPTGWEIRAGESQTFLDVHRITMD